MRPGNAPCFVRQEFEREFCGMMLCLMDWPIPHRRQGVPLCRGWMLSHCSEEVAAFDTFLRRSHVTER